MANNKIIQKKLFRKVSFLPDFHKSKNLCFPDVLLKLAAEQKLYRKYFYSNLVLQSANKRKRGMISRMEGLSFFVSLSVTA